MSVAYRTFLLQLFCLPTDEPDPDTFSYEQGGIDWTAALTKVQNREECLALWAKAKAANAPATILTAIEDKGKSFA
jgi:hypothetical protein